MEKTNVKELIPQLQKTAFPCGTCCTDWRNERCANCRYMEMDNNAYNDGTRRCAWRGEWLHPSARACYKFSY